VDQLNSRRKHATWEYLRQPQFSNPSRGASRKEDLEYEDVIFSLRNPEGAWQEHQL